MKRIASRRESYDAVVVGSGPNGLSAAIALAREGLSTVVVEAKPTPGGGARSEALTLPGFVHDVCSSVHPLGVGSPFFRGLPLSDYGLEWIQPAAPVGHLLADGEVVLLSRSIDATARELGGDGEAYARLVEPFVERFDELMPMLLGPVRLPSSPALLARFGLSGVRSVRGLAEGRFRGQRAPALFAGLAAHAMLPLEWLGTASFGLVLAAAGHAVGWPFARGGSRAITEALVRYLQSLGGELVLGEEVEQLEQLPRARAYLLDVTPRQALAIAGARLNGNYARRLANFRYGPGVYKMDFALRAPIPWIDPRARTAGTIHLAGDLEEVAFSEAAVQAGVVSDRPFVLVVQSSLFDPTRAPQGMHTAWAYCHVPQASPIDAADVIEARIERFAPGFREQIVARSARGTRALERYDANYIGGDINGGRADFGQLLFRPLVRLDPYATPAPDLFLCSSSTPPGGGVHGMCGYWAAESALRRVFGVQRRAELSHTYIPRSVPP